MLGHILQSNFMKFSPRKMGDNFIRTWGNLTFSPIPGGAYPDRGFKIFDFFFFFGGGGRGKRVFSTREMAETLPTVLFLPV